MFKEMEEISLFSVHRKLNLVYENFNQFEPFPWNFVKIQCKLHKNYAPITLCHYV